MAFCRCLREVYTRLRIWTYRNVVVDTRGARRADRKMPWSGPVSDFIECPYLFIYSLRWGSEIRAFPEDSQSIVRVELFDLTMEPQRNFNPERELQLGILVIVSLSSNYLFLYHVTPPLELF